MGIFLKITSGLTIDCYLDTDLLDCGIGSTTMTIALTAEQFTFYVSAIVLSIG